MILSIHKKLSMLNKFEYPKPNFDEADGLGISNPCPAQNEMQRREN